MKKIIHLNTNDNVVVAITPFHKNELLSFYEKQIIIRDEIPAGHKIAIKNIAKKTSIVKYGFSIGNATVDIVSGEHVHIHNLSSE